MSFNESTAYAKEQTLNVKRSLGGLEVMALVISAVISIDLLGETSTYGQETFTWALVLAIFFLIPYGLISAEIGSAFIGHGGVYLWIRHAFGRPIAAIATMFSWLTQPVWVGGSMAFLAAETWNLFIAPLDQGSPSDYLFKIVFIWITVTAAIVSLKRGKWLPTAGAILKMLFLVFFIFTTILYALKFGIQTDFQLSNFSPSLIGFLGVVPLLLFSFLGFESVSNASGEMKNPQRDMPRAILRSATITAFAYLLPIFAILLVVPAKEITGVSGLMDAVKTVFSVYGDGAAVMLFITALTFVFVLASQGASWMIISDRMQAIAGADGSFFRGFFGKIHAGLGTPVRVNFLSGIVATVFMLVAMQLSGTSAAIFSVVLTISISTYLLSYLFVVPAMIKLRTGFPDVERPFRVPVSDAVFRTLGLIVFAWILLGAWVTIFPGTLEQFFGVAYDFEEIWGVDQFSFELLTIGTLGVVLALGIVGYLRGAPLRAVNTVQPDGLLVEDEELVLETDPR